jgi:hypothetical protein
MRRSNLLWLLLAAFCAAALYHTSQRVHDSGEKLAVLMRETSREEESIRVLQAEWSYLNQPARLEKLSAQYLKLVPMKGARFIAVGDIASHTAVVQISDAAKRPLAGLVQEEAAPAAVNVASQPSPIRKFGDVMKSLGVVQ